MIKVWRLLGVGIFAKSWSQVRRWARVVLLLVWSSIAWWLWWIWIWIPRWIKWREFGSIHSCIGTDRPRYDVGWDRDENVPRWDKWIANGAFRNRVTHGSTWSSWPVPVVVVFRVIVVVIVVVISVVGTIISVIRAIVIVVIIVRIPVIIIVQSVIRSGIIVVSSCIIVLIIRFESRIDLIRFFVFG